MAADITLVPRSTVGLLASRGDCPKNKVARIKSRSRADNAPPLFFMFDREPRTLAQVFTTCCRKMGNLRGALTFLLDIYGTLF